MIKIVHPAETCTCTRCLDLLKKNAQLDKKIHNEKVQSQLAANIAECCCCCSFLILVLCIAAMALIVSYNVGGDVKIDDADCRITADTGEGCFARCKLNEIAECFLADWKDMGVECRCVSTPASKQHKQHNDDLDDLRNRLDSYYFNTRKLKEENNAQKEQVKKQNEQNEKTIVYYETVLKTIKEEMDEKNVTIEKIAIENDTLADNYTAVETKLLIKLVTKASDLDAFGELMLFLLIALVAACFVGIIIVLCCCQPPV